MDKQHNPYQKKHVCLDVPDVVWSNYINYKNDHFTMNVFSSPPEPLILKPLKSYNWFGNHLSPLPFVNCAQETRAANASAASKWPIFLRRSLRC